MPAPQTRADYGTMSAARSRNRPTRTSLHASFETAATLEPSPEARLGSVVGRAENRTSLPRERLAVRAPRLEHEDLWRPGEKWCRLRLAERRYQREARRFVALRPQFYYMKRVPAPEPIVSGREMAVQWGSTKGECAREGGGQLEIRHARSCIRVDWSTPPRPLGGRVAVSYGRAAWVALAR